MTTDSILDIVVILLLVPTIVYAVILNRRLTALRKSRDELSKVVSSFNEATMRAEAGIPKLKKATAEAGGLLKDRVEKAQTLRDDLAFMIERAEELASRLEGAVRAARSEGVASAPAQSAAASGIGGLAARNTYADVPARSSAPAAGTLAHTVAGFEESAADLRSALGSALGAARAEARVAGPAGSAGTSGAVSGPGLARPKRTLERQFERPAQAEPSLEEERSEAERELLKALQSAR